MEISSDNKICCGKIDASAKLNVPENYILFCSAEELDKTVRNLAEQINPWIKQKTAESGQPVLVCPIMYGSMFFAADLTRKFTYPVKVFPFQAKSYGLDAMTISENGVQVDDLHNLHFENENVLLIDDICDTGKTLEKVKSEILALGAHEVSSVVLIRREVEDSHFSPDFVGLRYGGSEWFVGYGMDGSSGLWRNLDSLYLLKNEKNL